MTATVSPAFIQGTISKGSLTILYSAPNIQLKQGEAFGPLPLLLIKPGRTF
jgi:hypothetical protein